jgi:hypothetical protein
LLSKSAFAAGAVISACSERQLNDPISSYFKEEPEMTSLTKPSICGICEQNCGIPVTDNSQKPEHFDPISGFVWLGALFAMVEKYISNKGA